MAVPGNPASRKGRRLMKVSEIVAMTDIRPINEYRDRDVDQVYISDMVSDIITGAKANSVLITLQTHKSLVAAANLVNVAMVVIVRGRKPTEDVIELANRAGIGLFTYDLDTWAFAKKLTELGY
ncbi:MAG: serine kinase [Candidatus Eisenbacteria bacterium]|nr:serine kinase [Candidatus Eisenbacteria bacterium]